jgi:integrase/recombinase XerD
VPSARRRPIRLPVALDAAAVRAVLEVLARQSVKGARDYAIILLLARLGIRAKEAAGLLLGDINWRTGRLLIRRKGGRVEELPLPVDVGQAIADYLRLRPAGCVSRAVFVTVRAPYRAMTRSNVGQLVGQACQAAGVAAGTPHGLRHGLASALLNAGAPLDEIGFVLGHRQRSTTQIYARVDNAALGELVRPWPAGA